MPREFDCDGNPGGEGNWGKSVCIVNMQPLGSGSGTAWLPGGSKQCCVCLESSIVMETQAIYWSNMHCEPLVSGIIVPGMAWLPGGRWQYS